MSHGSQSPDPSAKNPDRDFLWLWTLGALALLCGVLFFYKLGSYPLMDIDEPRYAEAAREMLESGNWITPHFNYELRFEKPILFYWLTAASYLLFGVSEFAARFASALMAMVLVLSTFAFGRMQVSTRFGLYAALILATAIEVLGIARASITDMTLACLMMLTIYTLFLAAVKSPRYWLWGGVFSGLAVLTKGPVGLVLPGIILVLYTLLSGQFKKTLFNRWFVGALVLCAVVALPWYVAAYRTNGSVFLDSLFFNNVTRFSDVVTGHSQARFQLGPVNVFFAVVLLAGFMPWTIYLPVVLGHWGRLLRSVGHRALLASNRLYPLALYGAVWTLVVLVFFSVSKTKLLTYILPLFPGLALLSATVFESAMATNTSENAHLAKRLGWAAWGLSGVLTLGLGAFLVFRSVLLAKLSSVMEPLVSNPGNVLAVVVLVLGSVCVAKLLSARAVTAALVAQASVMAFMVVIALHHVVPVLSETMQGDVLGYAKSVHGKPLAVYEIQRPSLTFYTRHQVPWIKHNEYDTLYRLLAKNPVLYVITKNSYLRELGQVDPARATVQLVENGPVYSLLAVEKPLPGAATKGQP